MPERTSLIGVNWHTMDGEDIEISQQKRLTLGALYVSFMSAALSHIPASHITCWEIDSRFASPISILSNLFLLFSSSCNKIYVVGDCALQQDVEVSVCLSGLWPRAWCICRPARPTYVHRSAFPSSLLPKTQTAFPASTRLSSRSGVPRVSLPLFSGLL